MRYVVMVQREERRDQPSWPQLDPPTSTVLCLILLQTHIRLLSGFDIYLQQATKRLLIRHASVITTWCCPCALFLRLMGPPHT